MNKATIELDENDLRHLCPALKDRSCRLEMAHIDTRKSCHALRTRIITAFVDQGVLPKSAGELLIGGK